MPDLWQTLSYDDLASRVARGLRDKPGIEYIEGPPGIGKSWLSKGIGTLWDNSGGSTIVAEGDLFSVDTDFYPFLGYMLPIRENVKRSIPGLANLALAAETLLGTAGVITATVQAISQTRKARDADKPHSPYLGDQEQSILAALEELADNRPILLVADNFHRWDRQSLRLLGRLFDPNLQQAMPFLTDLRVLAVVTPEPYQSLLEPDAHSQLVSPAARRVTAIPRIPREGFEAILEALGAPADLDDDVIEAAYSHTGGNLAVVSRAVDHIVRTEDTSFLLDAADEDEFLHALLVERMQALGELGERVLQLLHLGAVLGHAFRREEALCASPDDETEVATLLHRCREEELLVISAGTCSFTHDTYRRYFLELGVIDRVQTHLRLVECLRKLRPAEYGLRSINAQRAGLDEEGPPYWQCTQRCKICERARRLTGLALRPPTLLRTAHCETSSRCTRLLTAAILIMTTTARLQNSNACLARSRSRCWQKSTTSRLHASCRRGASRTVQSAGRLLTAGPDTKTRNRSSAFGSRACTSTGSATFRTKKPAGSVKRRCSSTWRLGPISIRPPWMISVRWTDAQGAFTCLNSPSCGTDRQFSTSLLQTAPMSSDGLASTTGASPTWERT